MKFVRVNLKALLGEVVLARWEDDGEYEILLHYKDGRVLRLGVTPSSGVKVERETAEMTEQDFLTKTGHKPTHDDLDRVNCQLAGQIGHKYCGVCEHGLPKFEVCYQCHPDWKNL